MHLTTQSVIRDTVREGERERNSSREFSIYRCLSIYTILYKVYYISIYFLTLQCLIRGAVSGRGERKK